MNISFKSNIQHSYMVIEKVREFSEHQYVIKILFENDIPGLLKIGFEHINGQYDLLYDISSRQAFSRLFEARRMSFDHIQAFLFSLKGVLCALQEYLLDPDNIILKQECIFADAEGKKYEFCYFPYYNGNLVLELRELFDRMLTMVDYEDESAVRLVYEMHSEAQAEHFTINNLMEAYERTAAGLFEQIEPGEAGPDWSVPRTQLGSSHFARTALESAYWTSGHSERFGETSGREGVLTSGSIPKVQDVLPEIAERNNAWTEDREDATFFEKLKYYLKGRKILEILEDINNREFMDKVRQCGRAEQIEPVFHPADVLLPEQKPDFEYIRLSDIAAEDSFAEEAGYEGTVLLDKTGSGARKLAGLNKQKDMRFVIRRYPFTIGKSEKDSDAFLNESTVSRIHARIYETEEGYAVEDLNSTNGTYLNEIRLPAYTRTPLAEGDVLRFAEEEFCFR